MSRHVNCSSAVACLCAALAGGCAPSTNLPESDGRSARSANAVAPLPPVALPELTRTTDSVRQQLQERFQAFNSTVANPRASAPDRAAAYGEMGKLLMAAGYLEAAESFFLHAESHAAGESRWPYYLGQIHKTRGDAAGAARFFERALRARNNDPLVLIRLADTYLALGRPELAQPLLTRALELDPRLVAVRFRLGRTALAREDYAAAVTHFEEALKLDPGAAAVHYPLGVAYRQLGDQMKAHAHLRQRVDADVPVADRIMAELSDLLDSASTYERRGISALDRGDWPAAEASFRRGLELSPGDPSLHHRLGTALFMSGKQREGMQEFEQALRASPRFAKAHYSLGVLMESSGRTREAIDRFTAAITVDPGYTEARLRLAAVLGRSGRADQALVEYGRILEIDPGVADARYLRAVTLMQMQRYEAARDDLVEAAEAYPDRPAFTVALGRLLATAPDDRVRDPGRALAVLEALPPEQRNPEWAEATAMTLAALRRFDEAIALQRQAIAFVEKAGQNDRAARMTEALRRYERRIP